MTPRAADATLFQSLEERLMQPEVRASASALDGMLHDAFVEIGRSGRTYARADVIEALLAEPDSASMVEITDLRAHHLANDVVQVIYTSARRAPNGSTDRHTLRSSVWVRGKEGWQIVFHQGTPKGSHGG